MANHEKKITLTDLQQKILSNDLYNDETESSVENLLMLSSFRDLPFISPL